MKDETSCIAIEEFVGLKTKMYLLLLDHSSLHKKAKGANKNVVARYSGYKDVLLNDDYFRHSKRCCKNKPYRTKRCLV